MDDGKTEGEPQFDYSPLNSPERSSMGFSAYSSAIVTSKFAPDHCRRNSQNNDFTIKPQKTDLRESTTLRESIE